MIYHPPFKPIQRYAFLLLFALIEACGIGCGSADDQAVMQEEEERMLSFSSACQPTGMACSNLEPFGGNLFSCSYVKDDAGQVDSNYTESVAELEDVYNCQEVGSPLRNQARFCCAPKPEKTAPVIIHPQP